MLSMKALASLGRAVATGVAKPRTLSMSTTASALPDKMIRFIAANDGEEYWGAFSNPEESSARVCRRSGVSGKMEMTDEVKSIEAILPPVDPPQIFCVGLNYADHIAETKMQTPTVPVIFTKTLNCLTGHKSAIIIPSVAREPAEVDYEAELAVVIGKEAKNVRAEQAMDYVAGFTIANDVTARRWQGKKGGGQWARGKCFDTFLPLGPYVVPKGRVNLADCKIRTWVNGDLLQDGNTSQMIFSVPQLIEFISQGTTLLPGSLILTGTPAGVGYVKGNYLKAGDDVSGGSGLWPVVGDNSTGSLKARWKRLLIRVPFSHDRQFLSSAGAHLHRRHRHPAQPRGGGDGGWLCAHGIVMRTGALCAEFD